MYSNEMGCEIQMNSTEEKTQKKWDVEVGSGRREEMKNEKRLVFDVWGEKMEPHIVT